MDNKVSLIATNNIFVEIISHISIAVIIRNFSLIGLIMLQHLIHCDKLLQPQSGPWYAIYCMLFDFCKSTERSNFFYLKILSEHILTSLDSKPWYLGVNMNIACWLQLAREKFSLKRFCTVARSATTVILRTLGHKLTIIWCEHQERPPTNNIQHCRYTH